MFELIKISIVFIFIILLTSKKVDLWISLLINSVLMGFLFRLPVINIVKDIVSPAWDEKTLLLLGALIGILLFSNLLKETGRMDEIIEGFRGLLKDIRIVIALLPAIIGLMPIVGGALVSAPMVVAGSDELKLSPERRTFINFWFRHLWEFILPTFPGLMLASTLAGIPVRRLGWINLPLTVTAILSGTLIGFWGVPKSISFNQLSIGSCGRKLFINLCPLIVALILVIGFQVELVYAFGLTILGMIIAFRIHWRLVLKKFKESLDLGLFLIVFFVMGFKNVLESSQSIPAISATLSSSGVPPWLIAMSIPFLIGLMTGMPFGMVGIVFPILIPLFRNDPNFSNYIMLSIASGMGGTLVSPLHLCLVLTKDYFKADWKGVYRFIIIPVACVMMVGLLKTLIFRIP